MAGPIDIHPLRQDPVSANAINTVEVGQLRLIAISDGFFRVPERFLGTPESPTAGYDHLADEQGSDVRLPIGCFLVPGERNTLIDLGAGPTDLGGRGLLIGGRLLEHLAAMDMPPSAIHAIALSHLHADHIGWLADTDGRPTFPNATVYLGRRDWEYFVTGGAEPAPAPHLLHALQQLDRAGRLELLDGETDIAPGVRSLPAPGHTPGHTFYTVHDRGERVTLVGDALYCPGQMLRPDWRAVSDVDTRLATETLYQLVRDLEDGGGTALGCHFPGLLACGPDDAVVGALRWEVSE